MNKEEQFDFYWNEIFGGLEWAPIEFSVYRFDESLSLPDKFNTLYKMFKQLALNNQEVMDYLKEFVKTFDSNLYKSVTAILDEWAKTGKFDKLIEEKFGEDLKELRDSIKTLENEKASKEYVDNIASSLTGGSPTEWFATLADLQAKYPNGKSGTFLVGLQNGQKYIYLYIDGEWKNVSNYPNSNIALKSVNIPRTTFINPKVNGLNNVTISTLHANLSNGTNISGESLSNTSIYFPIVGGKSFAFRKLSTTYFIVGTTDGVPTFGSTMIDRTNFNGGSTGVMKTSANATHMVIWLYNTEADTLSFEEILASLIVVEGNSTDDAHYILSESIKIDQTNLIEHSIGFSKMEETFDTYTKNNLLEKGAELTEKPLNSYQSTFKNNIPINRESEIVKIKIEFKDNELIDPECLELLVNGNRVGFEFMDNYSEYDVSTRELYRYASGFIRCGYIVFNHTFTNQQEYVATVNVYGKKVSSFAGTAITFSQNETSPTSFNITTGALNINGTGRIQLMRYNNRRINTTTAGDFDYLQMIDASGARVVLGNGTLQSLDVTGGGKIFKKMVFKYKSTVSGIDLIYTLVVYNNETIEATRTIVFSNYSNAMNGLRFRQNFHNPEYFDTQPLPFNEKSDVLKSIGGSIEGKNAVATCKYLQFIPNGGGDGFNSTQLTSGSTGLVQASDPMGGSLAESVNVNTSGSYKPKTNDSFSMKMVYNFYNATLENIELMTMNPIVVQATDTLIPEMKEDISKKLIRYILNNYDTIKDNTTFKGISVVIEIANAVLTNEIEENLSIINQKFDDFVSFYKDSETIYEKYLAGRGIEYAGRDSSSLKTIIDFYRNIDTTRYEKAKDLSYEFTKFYVLVEAYSGSNGNVYLQPTSTYSALNSMSAALNSLLYTQNTVGLTEEQATVFTRIETLFLSSARYVNILPYGISDGILNNITYHYKLHYHVFSLYDYLANKKSMPPLIDVASYINEYTTPIGKIEEFGSTFQSTRRGLDHTSLYAMGVLLKKNDASSVTVAEKLIDNLLLNNYPNRTKNATVTPWITNEIVPHNLAIQLQLAYEIYEKTNIKR